MTATELLNKGVIRSGEADAGNEPAERTIIVSGLGRSGTSMVAAMLAGFGILSTEIAYETTLDDREFLHLLKFRQAGDFRAAIAARNQLSRIWGFKLPAINGYLEAPELHAFRNPRLIIVFRDPVAVAARHAIAEQTDPLASFFETLSGMSDLVGFLRAAECPILLVSYEKAVTLPDQFVTALAGFCGVELDAAGRERAIAIVRPNNLEYAQNARRRYEGNIDGIFDSHLVGWCREIGELEPARLVLLVNGVVRLSFSADHLRDDLCEAGIGNGRHGFVQSLHGLGVVRASILTVRVEGRIFDVPGSGKCAWQYQR